MLDTLYNPARCACGAPVPPPLAGMATNGEGDAARFWIFSFKSDEDVGRGSSAGGVWFFYVIYRKQKSYAWMGVRALGCHT